PHRARLDPALLVDPGAGERDHRRRGAGEPDAEPIQPELPIRELLRQAYAEAAGDQSGEAARPHRHAQSVTVTGTGPADPDAVLDFVADRPAGVCRVEGTVLIRHRGRSRASGVQADRPTGYVADDSRLQAATGDGSVLVVSGEDGDEGAVRRRAVSALGPAGDAAAPRGAGVERLLHHVRLHS